MAANVAVHKGGRLRLYIDSIGTTGGNNTFKIPANFRIEYVYAIITTEITNATTLHGIEMTMTTTTDAEAGIFSSSISILKSSPHYISGAIGTFIDLTPRINRRLFSYNESSPADYTVTVSQYEVTKSNGAGYSSSAVTWTAQYKLIIGLESII
jgi:hypothetical protein